MLQVHGKGTFILEKNQRSWYSDLTMKHLEVDVEVDRVFP